MLNILDEMLAMQDYTISKSEHLRKDKIINGNLESSNRSRKRGASVGRSDRPVCVDFFGGTNLISDENERFWKRSARRKRINAKKIRLVQNLPRITNTEAGFHVIFKITRKFNRRISKLIAERLPVTHFGKLKT